MPHFGDVGIFPGLMVEKYFTNSCKYLSISRPGSRAVGTTFAFCQNLRFLREHIEIANLFRVTDRRLHDSA